MMKNDRAANRAGSATEAALQPRSARAKSVSAARVATKSVKSSDPRPARAFWYGLIAQSEAAKAAANTGHRDRERADVCEL